MPNAETHSRRGAGSTSVSLELFVALYRTEKPERLQAIFARHVAWATEQEAAGRMFLSGPLVSHNDEKGPSGLTVFRVGSLDEAEALVRTDPFITEGVNSVQVLPWTIAGGSLNISLQLSNSAILIR
jgi:uncharacterized protein YciI